MARLGLILGNQLFADIHIKKLNADQYFMAEDQGLCTHYKYHKHKLIFFLTAMRKFAENYKENMTYYDSSSPLFDHSFEVKLDDYLNKHQISEVSLFEIEDKFFEDRIKLYFKNKNIPLKFVKSPMFLVSRESFQDYLSKYKKPLMKNFYELKRKEFKVLLDSNLKPEGGKWSFDEQNRKKLPKSIEYPQIPKIESDEHLNNVSAFVDHHFDDHPGLSTNFWLPTSRKESLKWLQSFLKDRIEHFGDYQDAITKDSDFVFHSVLSPMINIGLLTPDEVITETIKLFRKEKMPLNSVEGFIRQILGWREFVRGIYQNFSQQQDSSNFWKNTRKMNTHWYKGNTGIEILDDAILKANKYSYTHHIERLMVLSNIMLLCELDPKEVHKWFMEMHSDSSDWVMGPNVYGMGQFSDGGIFATKPYICGSNYYRKMSRYPKGDWCDIADGLYWRFIDKHQEFYKTNPRMSIMLKSLAKMDLDRKDHIFKQAQEFIDKVTLKGA